jgi:hypothetical protein
MNAEEAPMHVDEFPDPAILETTTTDSAGGGILVLSPTREVVYMSGRAMDLLKSIQEAEVGLAMPGVIPTVIHDFCNRILDIVATRGLGTNGISCEVRRMAGDPERPIVLRGFALSAPSSTGRSHMVIILEERGGHC